MTIFDALNQNMFLSIMFLSGVHCTTIYGFTDIQVLHTLNRSIRKPVIFAYTKTRYKKLRKSSKIKNLKYENQTPIRKFSYAVYYHSVRANEDGNIVFEFS